MVSRVGSDIAAHGSADGGQGSSPAFAWTQRRLVDQPYEMTGALERAHFAACDMIARGRSVGGASCRSSTLSLSCCRSHFTHVRHPLRMRKAIWRAPIA